MAQFSIAHRHHRFARIAILGPVIDMIRLARQRRQLAGLDADRLEDIGISEAQARTEATRPFWDIPDYWKG